MAEQSFNKTLLSVTDDAFKSSRLELMLRNFTASYKHYFLKGLFEEVVQGARQLSFELIAARMIASAWYPVTYYRLNLGVWDSLADAVGYARDCCGLPPNAGESDVIGAVLASEDRGLKRRMRDLCRYVPYRLIRPFYSERLDAERTKSGNRNGGQINTLIERFNIQDSAGAPYRFLEDRSGVEIDPDWANYFIDNQHVIRGWLDIKLVDYLQARNPSVPAISQKIRPPFQRDLTAARSYWNEALSDHPFREIYSGIVFDAVGYQDHGPLSVDHFIPWSFVLHDEPWNLVPMFRDLNSSKGDKLPELDDYLGLLCNQHFDALMTLRDTGRHKEIIEAYASVDGHILEYERSDASLESFSASLGRVIVPLHQIALNQGFPVWHPSAEYGFIKVE